ncbi:MAG: DUF1759 domain-containing protein, partial [Gammaproteobacteria bacterium]|nr:DUF1759 domain-containing protein [Gammaproteobacteria bacterium]
SFQIAVDILTERFGQMHLIVESLQNQLMGLQLTSSRAADLRIFFDRLNMLLRQLGDVDKESSQCGMTCQLVIGKLPSHVYDELLKMNFDQPWTTQTFVEKLGKYVSHQETVARKKDSTNGISISEDIETEKPSAKRVFSDPPICIFCGERHFSSSCVAVTDFETRKVMIAEQSRCFLCLRKGHFINDCPQKNSSICKGCKQTGKHHSAICPSEFQQSTGLSVIDRASHPPSNKHFPIISKHPHKHVMLSTASVPITNYQSSPVMARVLLDNANQRSYIKASLAAKLGLSQLSSESLRVKVFLGHSHSLETSTVNFSLFHKDGTLFPMRANVVPEITNGVARFSLNTEDKSFLQRNNVREESFADVPPDDTPFSPDILIGADYYWNLVTGPLLSKPRQLPSGLFLVPSHLGWIISGMDESRNAPPVNTVLMSQVCHVISSTTLDNPSIVKPFPLPFLPPYQIRTTKSEKKEVKRNKRKKKSFTPSSVNFISPGSVLTEKKELNLTKKTKEKLAMTSSENTGQTNGKSKKKFRKENLNPGIRTLNGRTSLSSPPNVVECAIPRERKKT